MTKYIKGKDGKFSGSIGDGKGKVPTSTLQQSPRHCTNCGKYGNSYIARRLDAGSIEFYCDDCQQDEARLGQGEDLGNLYERFRSARAEETPEAPEFTVDIVESSDDNFVMYPSEDSRLHAYASLQEDGSWDAKIAADYEIYMGAEVDDEDVQYVSTRNFATRAEAEAWAEKALRGRTAEAVDIDARIKADPRAIRASWAEKVARYGDDGAFEEEIIMDNEGHPRAWVSGYGRSGSIHSMYGGGFVVDVQAMTLNDGESGIHFRTYPTFEEAFLFGKTAVLDYDEHYYDDED
jgi:hypothetical protein